MKRDLFSASHLVLAAIALLVGIGIGRFSPQSELRRTKQALAVAEARRCDDAGAVGRQIAEALGGRPVVDLPEDRGPRQADVPLASPKPSEEPAVEPNAIVAGEGDGSDFELDFNGFDDLSPEEQSDRLGAIRDAVAMRKAQARQAFIEQVDPTDAQLTVLEDVVAEMNDALVDEAATFMDTVREGDPTRREGLEFARNTIDVLLDAEDGLRDSLTDDQLDQADPEALDPLGFIDPTLVETLVELR
ncbi:MAG: hypothetical protein AAGA48_12120 [Myxococcota bacterium]